MLVSEFIDADVEIIPNELKKNHIKNICRKYQIHTLMPFCDQYFKSNLNHDNFGIWSNDAIEMKYNLWMQYSNEYYKQIQQQNTQKLINSNRIFFSKRFEYGFYYCKYQKTI